MNSKPLPGIPVPVLGGEERLPTARLLRACLEGGPCDPFPLSFSQARSLPDLRVPLLVCTGLPRAHLLPAREVLEGLSRRSDLTVLDGDDHGLQVCLPSLAGPLFLYSERHQSAALTAEGLRILPGRLQFEAVAVGAVGRVVLPLSGPYSLYHALAALAAALNLGVPMDRAAAAIGRAARRSSPLPQAGGGDKEVS